MSDSAPASAPANPEGPLSGIRVLDFGRYIAGPFCAALLAEFGADVIRVERPEGGEDRFLMPIAQDGTGALFMQMNRNKRSLALDPKSDTGRAATRRLIASADIVVANLPPATLKKMGLDYDTLRALREDIILINLTAYGDQGPWHTRPGFDGVGQVMTGGAWLTGENGTPRRAQVNWVDHLTASNAAFGAVLALFERQRSGRGQEVRGALLRSALSANAPTLIEQATIQRDRQPCGNRGLGSAPNNLFEARDGGWLVMQTVGPTLFERLARLAGYPEWLEDPRFDTDESRVVHEMAMLEPLAEWCLQQERDALVERLCEAGIPAAPVLSPSETLQHPQVLATGQLQEMAIPGMATPGLVSAAPISLLGTPGSLRRPPPGIGEHNDEILAELGLNAR
ncbi:formyl-CoA transferase [Alcanivorax sp. N3-2A]|nr:formyl-CoA transferase [Alcanivorax sp. N3-2A]|tara:strand:+ start:16349 stop:17539 length:1191 start_codon:yes stop_codon:yes gene_type:complete